MSRLFYLNGATKASQQAREAVERGRGLWREAFSIPSTDKESGGRERFVNRPARSRPTPGGSYGRSSISEPASMKRLLQAMRSMAPGGWSDDRWEQSFRNFIGIAYVAIHRIASMWQQAEFQLFRKVRKDKQNPDGKVPVNEDDPPEGDRLVKPYDLVRLLERPNRQDYFGKYMYRVCQQKYLTGTALTWMVPNALGVPHELYCIPTAIAIPQPAINPDYPDGYYRIQPIYPYGPFSSYPTPATAVGAPIPAQWVLRFQYPHPLLRYEGYSPLTGLDLEMDEFKMIGRSRHYKMRRTLNPSVVLETTEMEGSQQMPAEEIERLKTELENMFFGPEQAGGVLAPPPGCKVSEYGLSPAEMDYPQSWSQMVDFLLAGFGITKPAAGMVEDSSYSTLFATLKQLYWLTLDPDFSDVGQELTHHLCPFFGDDLLLEVRGRPINDHDISLQKADRILQAKAGTINQYLKLLDLPLVEEPWGQERLGTEQAQQGMPGGLLPPAAPLEGVEAGLPGQMPVTGVPADAGGQPGTPLPVEARLEPPEVASSRPSPGNLSAGALGPRKSLEKAYRRRISPPTPKVRLDLTGTVNAKSFYERALEVCRNGHH